MTNRFGSPRTPNGEFVYTAIGIAFVFGLAMVAILFALTVLKVF